MSSLLATYEITFWALTLLPASSSGGANTAIAPLPGTIARMAAAHPALGRESDVPRPAAGAVVETSHGHRGECPGHPRPDDALAGDRVAPLFARVAPICASCFTLTPTEHRLV